MYTTEVTVKAIPVADWLSKYCAQGENLDACRACPDYGQVWSCPPGLPGARELLGGFQTAHIVGVRVIYDAAERARALRSPGEAEAVRQESYGKVKKALMDALLALEQVCPGATTIAAGRCEQCDECTRPYGQPCRKPERLRYSFSAFGFNLTAIARDLLDMELLWADKGLPEYQAAIAAFVTR